MKPNLAFVDHRADYPEREPPERLIANNDQRKLLTTEEGLREFDEAPNEEAAWAPTPRSEEGAALNRHLWVVTKASVPYALESSPFSQTLESRVIKHTNLTGAKPAITGGEMWFVDGATIIINGCSGRYGPQSEEQLRSAALAFKSCGFQVGYIGYNELLAEWGEIVEDDGDLQWV